MNDNQNSHDDHFEPTQEQMLLTDRALGEGETDPNNWREPDEYELAAAQIAVAYAELESQDMPDSLRTKLRTMANEAPLKAGPVAPSSAAQLADAKHGAVTDPPRPLPLNRNSTGKRTMLNAAGWLAAAAAITVAAIGWMRPIDQTPASQSGIEQTVGQKLAALEAEPDTVSAEWFAWPAGTLAPDTDPRPAASDVSGRFVWNESLQQGYMVFEHMPVNDPKLEQYQLWLVSADHEHPIDGGVFDIASSERVIVPMDPKIRATNVAALGITVEKPGGVVVSSREDRLVASLVPQD
ncbi:MAG: anti-sigma factor domain-containing protein [Phycisphaerales bacterium JB065]